MIASQLSSHFHFEYDLVDPASSYTLALEIKPCMRVLIALWTAHYKSCTKSSAAGRNHCNSVAKTLKGFLLSIILTGTRDGTKSIS